MYHYIASNTPTKRIALSYTVKNAAAKHAMQMGQYILQL